MNNNTDYKELLKYSIKRILDEAEDVKKYKDKDYRQTLLQGYYNCILTICNDILLWHPCETDSEEKEILKEFGLDFPLEQILD